jgi:CHAT domain-containing protein/tetratricopeptide (TPR) repeat protein
MGMSQHHPFHRLFRILCFSGLPLWLWADPVWSGSGVSITNPTATGTAIVQKTAQENGTVAQPAASLLQEGLKHYQAGNFRNAIQVWQSLNTNSHHSIATNLDVQRYLVRAYQQVGQMDQAIAQLNQLIVHYRQIGSWQQFSHMLIEQAQIYTTLGHHRKAISLLCGEHRTPSNCLPETAVAISRNVNDSTGEAAALGSLGNAYRLRGEYDRAIAHLQQSLEIAHQIRHPVYLMVASNGLGNTYASLAKRNYRLRQFALQAGDQQAVEKFTQTAIDRDRQAISAFETSLALARSQGDTVTEVGLLLNLAIAYHKKHETGIKASPRTPNPEPRTPNPQLPNPHPTPDTLLQQAQAVFNRIPNSRSKAYAAIRLATLLQQVTLDAFDDRDLAIACLSKTPSESMVLLQQALKIAQHIGDRQAESFALGRLGHGYECQNDHAKALTLTQQAQLVAQTQDIRYLWEWQTGRILNAQGNRFAAIAAYENAIQTLNALRTDIAIASRDFQFDFRDTVEPIYRELTDLYLRQATSQGREGGEDGGDGGDGGVVSAQPPTPQSSSPSQAIALALRTIDRLRLAEIQNYLGDDCTLPVLSKPITLMEQKTAVIHTIIVNDRIAVILTLPGQEQGSHAQIHWIQASSKVVIDTVNDLRFRLEKRSDLTNTYLPPAQQVYDWLLRPLAPALQNAKVETLVFIQDGLLRSIPMATLHDGQHFLVERYAIASTLGLELVDPVPLDRQSLQVLGFGLTKPSAVDDFTHFGPLNYVHSEMESIQTALSGSKTLVDQAFTLERLQQELTQGDVPIVHLATHGKFGYDARDTFLVTGKQAEDKGVRSQELGVRGDGEVGEWGGEEVRRWEERQISVPKTPYPAPRTPHPYNEKLTMHQLYQMLRNSRRGKPLELLVLTACETAVGSDRAALGIAGISLQAGAHSAVASLWQVEDQATAELVHLFYQNLKQGMGRAKALQSAQKTWLQQHPGSHPGYWAALILVGNWL